MQPLKPLRPKTSTQDSSKGHDDIDDYYIFIYNQVDKSNQQKFNKSLTNFGASGYRVFGFWCFNPGVGFKEI